jgi:hypothetical protein
MKHWHENCSKEENLGNEDGIKTSTSTKYGSSGSSMASNLGVSL